METIEFKVQEFKNMTLNPDDAVADVNEKGRRICQVEIHEIPRVLREYMVPLTCQSTCGGRGILQLTKPRADWLM